MTDANVKYPVINIIGGGLSGCEAALTLADSGFEVNLFECRPALNMDIFKTDGLCELVCSNSLGSQNPLSAPGILKSELAALGSFVLAAAGKCSVPGGQALCVDRARLTAAISEKMAEYPNINIIRREVKVLSEFDANSVILLASGPLTTPSLFAELSKLLEARLYFYDAVAPIIDAASVDMDRAFWQDRYAKGTPDYLNIAFNKEEYDIFYDALITAGTVPPADNEKEIFFESCMPVEELARRGRHTLRFGPMKPKGFDDPRTGRMPYAVLQLRAEDNLFSSYNLVGFQTKMTFPEQKRILSLIPALANVKILRHGVIHKNHYIFSPERVNFNLSLKKDPRIFAAGQLLGSEGYTEAIATGKIAAFNIIRSLRAGDNESVLKHIDYERTMIGSLLIYLTKSIISMKKFVPMNANFGILNTTITSREELPIESALQIESLTSYIKNLIKK